MNKLPSMLRWSLNHNLLAILVLGGYVVAALVLSRIFEFSLRLDIYSNSLLLIVAAVALVYFTTIVVTAVRIHKPSRPITFLLPRLLGVHRVPQRFIMALPVLLLLPLFFSAFTSVKSAIEVVNPYNWDRTFMELDLYLHGGTAPWMWLQFVTSPLLTFGLAFFYNLWFLVMITVLVVAVFTMDRPRLRSQYLVAFALAWTILGTAGAIVFASMGPCFYDLAYPGKDNPFEPLMAYLNEVNQTYPVWALTAQEMLRQHYLAKQPGFGAGISAFPSMHIAVAVLNAIFGWYLSRVIGCVLTVFAVLVMIGSVHLGWHYAVDAYASALAVPFIWKVSGATVERWHARGHAEPVNTI
jgi:PAP2 superfamily